MNSLPLRSEYKPYIPNKWEKRVDALFNLVAPRTAEQRMLARERMNRYRHIAAMSNPTLPNAGPNTSTGETMQNNRDRLQMTWNAIETVESSGLASSVMHKIADYTCGTLRYQQRTGVLSIDNEHEDYLRIMLGRGMDVTRRRGIRKFARAAIIAEVLKGDLGVNIVREEGSGRLRFQGIEAERIGDPLGTKVTKTYVGGVHMYPWQEPYAYDIYSRDRATGRYYFEDTIPARDERGLPRFLHCANPVTFDEVRGRTVFKTILDNIRYINDIRRFELQALQWASAQSGVFYTNSGALPDNVFSDSIQTTDLDGQVVTNVRVRPNHIQAMGVAERVEMFKNERPSPNVINMYRETIKEVALGCRLSFAFVYDMSGMLGGAVRTASNQDKRSLTNWKEDLREDLLDPIALLVLGDGIARGEIAPHPRWANGAWMFPPHPTIDAGYDSAANINERAALLRSNNMIASEEGNDAQDILRDCSNEARAEIEAAMALSKFFMESRGEDVPWRECLGIIKPGKAIMMSPVFEGARAEQLDAQAKLEEEKQQQEQDKASTGGVEFKE